MSAAFIVKPLRPKTHVQQVRIDINDWDKIKEMSESSGIQASEIIRQAVHFALENMPGKAED